MTTIKMFIVFTLKLNYDRQSVGQSVLVSGTHLEPATNFFFLLEIFFRQLRVCCFVAPSLTRGWVCNLLSMLALASAVPRDSRPYFIVPIIETPKTWKARSPYLHPPGTGLPRYAPGHWVPFPSPLTNRRATAEVFYPAPTRDWLNVHSLKNLNLLYTKEPEEKSPLFYHFKASVSAYAQSVLTLRNS
jgi:hypothetical protein